MFQEKILKHLQEKGIRMTDLCEATGINRQNAYKALKSSNLDNPTLKKILEYLGLEMIISLQQKHGKIQKAVLSPKS